MLLRESRVLVKPPTRVQAVGVHDQEPPRRPRVGKAADRSRCLPGCAVVRNQVLNAASILNYGTDITDSRKLHAALLGVDARDRYRRSASRAERPMGRFQEINRVE